MTHEARVIVTGAAGFIGSHVCHHLANDAAVAIYGLDLHPLPADAPCPGVLADVRHLADVAAIGGAFEPRIIVHLAALAEVVTPFAALDDLYRTNVQGTLNVLRACAPRRMVLASSSAVYGSAADPVRPGWDDVRPLGAYGVSKVAAELACAQWAHEAAATAAILRFGNVIGPRCRGLIPYLVDHARAVPDGSRPARLRGGGRIVRDYVPVDHAVRAIERAAWCACETGSTVTFNVGTGRGLTNGDVASVVQRCLRERGYALEVEFSDAIAPGESEAIVLDVESTETRLGLSSPTEEDVVRAIERGVTARLNAAGAEGIVPEPLVVEERP